MRLRHLTGRCVALVVAAALLAACSSDPRQHECTADDAPPPSGSADAYPVDVQLGADFACLLLSDGRVMCWGDASYVGNVDLFSQEAVARPALIPRLTGVVTLALGDDSACVLAPDNCFGGLAPLCWGANQFGQLGDGDGDDQYAPFPV